MTPNLRGARPAPRRRAVLATMLPALALLAACGGASSGGAASTGSSPSGTANRSAEVATYPVTVTADNGSVTIAAQPKRIVSLSPTATEMLYAIGAGSQVVAVDDLSNYPAQAPKTSLSAFKPNVEAVVAQKPDLVVASMDMDGLMAALAKLKIPALLLPAAADLEASYVQETTLGKATGHSAAAAEVISRTKSRIAAAVASVPASAKGLKIYHEVDQTYYSVTSKTFLGGIYRLFGLTNIADAAPDAASGGKWPKLSAEYVVSAAPDLIVLADSKCCGQSPQAVGQRPAFAAVPAVAHGRVIAIDDDIASRWGPRTADFAEAVAKALGGK
ncbi:MAG TPA: ABC transporter substrate-binding protein [Kineosporiaceae bacterium]|nr:ABC transporter substrate-binding protein [Kineosporiaceae bacterium]